MDNIGKDISREKYDLDASPALPVYCGALGGISSAAVPHVIMYYGPRSKLCRFDAIVPSEMEIVVE
jgi:hypothetical protein